MCCSTILDWTLIDRTRSTCRSTSSEFQILSIDLAGFEDTAEDRKSTRLNSSHGYISYAVFCLKKELHSRPQLGYRPLLEEPTPLRSAFQFTRDQSIARISSPASETTVGVEIRPAVPQQSGAHL